mmetsp:Transcript_12359/g.28059  ORF Transcript_12359/g.28059 Transcript_12359/m.28059 type:complete len:273 (+) Transcript_12359:3-821(+)
MEDKKKPLSDQVYDLKRLVLLLLKVQRTLSDCFGDISNVVMLLGSKFETSQSRHAEDLARLDVDSQRLHNRVNAVETALPVLRRNNKVAAYVNHAPHPVDRALHGARSFSPPALRPQVVVSTAAIPVAHGIDTPGVRRVAVQPSIPRAPVIRRSQSLGVLHPLAAAPPSPTLSRQASWACVPISTRVLVEEAEGEHSMVREPVVPARMRSTSPCPAGIHRGAPGSTTTTNTKLPPPDGNAGLDSASSTRGPSPLHSRLLPAHPDRWPHACKS